MTDEVKALQREMAKLVEKNRKLEALNNDLLEEYFYLSRKLNQIEREADKKYPLLKEVQP